MQRLLSRRFVRSIVKVDLKEAACWGCTPLEAVLHVGHASLIEATQAGDVATVKALLDRGANPNCADEHGLTPLSLATSDGNRELVITLIAAGADVRARDVLGRTTLHHAACNGQTLIAMRLLMHGLDPLDTYDDRSSIEVAFAMGHRQLASILFLASRADLNRVRVLARSISASPTCPTDRGDRIIVRTLLDENGIDDQFEPLVTAFLQEIRNEKPRPKRAPPPRNRRERPGSDGSSAETVGMSRAERFAGVPPETVGVSRSWVLRGSDSVRSEMAKREILSDLTFAAALVRNSEEVAQGDFEDTIRRAARELDRIRIGSGTARDLLNEYYRRIKQSTGLEYFDSGMRATIMLYTDDRFYHVLNQHWRNQKGGELLGFSTLMDMAFRHPKYFMGDEVYRGVDLPDVDHYQQGLIFRWPFFVSASMRRDVATAFGKTLVTIEVPGAANVREINQWSLFPNEAEVLFRAYETFEVLESGPSEIRLRIFEDEYFGTGYEIDPETGQLRKIV